jgi:hypothetical protein
MGLQLRLEGRPLLGFQEIRRIDDPAGERRKRLGEGGEGEEKDEKDEEKSDLSSLSIVGRDGDGATG